MRKLAFCILAVILGMIYFQPSASAVSGITICHANGDGTYTQKVLVFTNASDAQRIAEYTPTTIVYHINHTDSDLWPAFTWDQSQYTQTYVSASHGYLHTVQKLVWVTVNRVRKQVLMWITEPDPAKVAIYNAGCAT